MAKEDTSVKLPKELRQQLQDLAQRDHRTLSNMIVVALTEWVANRDGQAPAR